MTVALSNDDQFASFPLTLGQHLIKESTNTPHPVPEIVTFMGHLCTEMNSCTSPKRNLEIQ